MTQSRQLTAAEEVRHSLQRMEPQFQAALPAHISPAKFIRVASTAIQTNPDLLNADRTSLYASCTKAAQDGLLPDGREAALVCFGKTVQYMPMIAGILKKLRNSGELSSITALMVHEKDPFRYWVDSDGEHLEFTPNMFGDRGAVIGAFAMAKLTDGALYVEVLTMAQIEKIRSVSRAAKNGPWVTWFDEMARKSALRRLSKRLPMSTDIDALFQDDDDERVVAADTGVTPAPPMTDITPPPEPKPRQSRARQAVQQATAAEDTAPAGDQRPEPPTIDGESDRVDDGGSGGNAYDEQIPI